MNTVRLVLVSCTVVLLASCSRQPHLPGKDGAALESTGHLGVTSSGNADAHFAIQTPYWHKADQVVICGMAEYPGRPLQPAFVLLLKLPSKTDFSASNSVGEKNEISYWHHEFKTLENKTLPVHYEVSHKPVGEQFAVGEQKYDLDAGRVFVVDLHSQPAQVTQVKDDVKDLIPGKEPGGDALKGALEKLRSRHKKVQELMPAP